MFDANAAHINIGEIFFAEVHSTDAQLESMGVAVGDIVLCSHISNLVGMPRFNYQTKIWTSIDSEPNIYTYTHNTDSWSWMVYSGRINGKGFINDEWKNKAKEFLCGE
jgi:hypothetical protein